MLGAALGFAGRAIGRRMKKAFEEKVMPAVEAKAAQAQQQWEHRSYGGRGWRDLGRLTA